MNDDDVTSHKKKWSDTICSIVILVFTPDWYGYPTTAVRAVFNVPSLSKFAAIMRPKRNVFVLKPEKRVLMSYPDEAVKVELLGDLQSTTEHRLILKVSKKYSIICI